jgi:Ricin-type beta-trefoil lectin domain
MKLTSNWSSGKLYWRTFTKDDTVYIVGLKEGFLSNAESTNFESPTGFFQMEIKRGDMFGSNLVAAGHVFNNDDEFIIGDDGMLTGIADAAKVSIDTGFKFEPYGQVTQFLSAASADSAIKIVSSLTQTTSSNNTHQATINNSASDERGTQFTTDVSVTDAPKPGKPATGIKVSGGVSDKVINKIERAIVNTLNIQIATTTAYSEDQNITLKAGKLTVIISSWQRRFLTGTVTIGHDVFPYDATVGYISSRQISEFISADDLPTDLMAAYRIQNPGYSPHSPNQNNKPKNKIIGLGNKCIDAAGASSVNGTPIILWDENSGINQLWVFDGEFIVSAIDANKCLDVQGAIANNGTPIILWEKHGGNNQKWIFNVADGSFSSLLDPKKCIDVRGNQNKNGAIIQLWEKNGGNNQKWHLG